MIYAYFPQKKIFTFGIFVALLCVTIVITILMKNKIPMEYYSVNGALAVSELPVKSLLYRLGFSYKGVPTNSPLAAVAAIFGIDRFTADSGTPEGKAVSVPALVYHGITSEPDRFSMTSQAFSDQMTALKRAGYHTISLDEMKRFIKGEIELDDKAILITFDDGRSDSYFGADPVLSALDFNAVMFVATASSLREDNTINGYYLHKALIDRMLRSGRWEIASHAVQETGGFVPIDAEGNTDNFLSNKKWLSDENRLETDNEYVDRVRNELQESKRILEETFDIDVFTLSYPFSDYGQQAVNNSISDSVIGEIVRTTYEMAFKQVWPNEAFYTSNHPGDDIFLLGRIEPSPTWTGDELVSYLENGRDKSKTFRDDFTGVNSWNDNWGEVLVESGVMTVHATEDSTGAFAFLDGTYAWDDYMFTSTGSLEGGETVSLAVRYQDHDNFALCTFFGDQVKIDQKARGEMRTLVSQRHDVDIPYSDFTLGARVEGDLLRCYAGNRVVAYTDDLDPFLRTGGIGLQVWDEEYGVADVKISNVTASDADSAGALVSELPAYNVR